MLFGRYIIGFITIPHGEINVTLSLNIDGYLWNFKIVDYKSNF